MDRNPTLASSLEASYISLENREIDIKDRLNQSSTTNKRKSISEQRLQSAVKQSKATIYCISSSREEKEVTGQQMKPMYTFQIGNYAFTSAFVWEGRDKENPPKDNWARVLTASQARGIRNNTSMFNVERQGRYQIQWINSQMVRGSEGATASGHVLSMVAVFSGLSEGEMPKEGFLVVPVKGLRINSDVDARSNELGYVINREKQPVFNQTNLPGSTRD